METFSFEEENPMLHAQEQPQPQSQEPIPQQPEMRPVQEVLLTENVTEILPADTDTPAIRSDDLTQMREICDMPELNADMQTEVPRQQVPELMPEEAPSATDLSGVMTSPMPPFSPDFVSKQPQSFQSYRAYRFLDGFRKTHCPGSGEPHTLYEQWTISEAGKTYLVRRYIQTTGAFFANFRELYENEMLKRLLFEVLWPIEISERDENGDFWCLLPAPDPDFVPLSTCIFPKQKKISAKYTTDLCISFVTFLCKCQNEKVQKFLKYFNPEEIFLDVTKGRVYFTGFDQIIDQRITQEAAQEIILHNQQQARTFLLERFMPPDFLEQEILPKLEDLNYYAALFSCLLLLRCHPYEGLRWAKIGYLLPKDAMALYGTDRRFLFDQTDTSNGPVPDLHDVPTYLWRMLPQRVQMLFTNSFSRVGASAPDTIAWLKGLIDLRCVTYFCPCGNVVINPENRGKLQCNLCKSEVSLPLQITFSDTSVYRLSSQMLLYYGQFDPTCADFRYAMPVCRIRTQKSTGAFGVESLVQNVKNGWTVWVKDDRGEEKMLEAGQPCPIRKGFRVYVNQYEAFIN